MAWASTKIKKRAADAFEAEAIETSQYRVTKPEGLLHVIGDDENEFRAYSKEFGDEDSAKLRKATLDIDSFPAGDFAAIRNEVVNSATTVEMRVDSPTICDFQTEELVNEIPVTGFYKIVSDGNAVHRLRFAVLPEHRDDWLRKIDETLNSFHIK
jgi:hypothetical protein